MSAADIELAGEARVFALAEVFTPSMRSVPQMLTRQAEHHGARTMVTVGEKSLSFAETRSLAASAGKALREAGVKPGDTVAIMCGNRMEFIQTFLGCAWCGAIAVPINTASRGAQLEHILRNCGARLAVIETVFMGVFAAAVEAGVPLQAVWMIGEAGEGHAFPLPSGPIPAMAGEMEAHPSKPSDTLAILYTSGTTGLSKGVCCPHAQYFWWGLHTAALLGIDEEDVLLTCLPLFHTNALNTFFQALLTGASIVVEQKFSASRFSARLAETGATVTYLLGAMVPILLSKERSEADSRHRTRITLAPGVPSQFHAPFSERFGINIIDGYGSTETNFVIGDQFLAQRPGKMGRVRPGFQIAIVDAEDNEVPAARRASLWFAPPSPSRWQPAISVRRKRRSRPGETSGSIRATGR